MTLILAPLFSPRPISQQLNASPHKGLDDKNIPFIDRCSGTLGDRSSILEDDEELERKTKKGDEPEEEAKVVSLATAREYPVDAFPR